MKSKLIMRRQKKSTVLVSKQTAEDALRVGNSLAQAWFAGDQNDPRLTKLQNAMDLISSVLKKTPEEMKQDGVSTVEEYFDDTKQPDMAQAVKKEIDMIAKLRREQRPAPPPQTQAAPAMAMASKNANGAAFTTDRDEKGEPKAPEKIEAPRLAAKREKEAAPAPAAAPVVPPVEAAAPIAPPAAPVAPPAESKTLSPNQEPGMKGDILLLPSDILTKVVKALTSIADLVNDKNGAALLADIAAELNTRPLEPEEKPEPKAAPAAPAPVPVAASLGGLAVAGFEEDKVANAATGGGWVANSDKGDVVEDGGRTPEVSEAHSKIDESPAKLNRPATELPGKFAALKPEFEQRVKSVAGGAQEAFWNNVVDAFPQADGGDVEPLEVLRFNQVCESVVRQWVELNVPGAAVGDTRSPLHGEDIEGHTSSFKAAAGDMTTSKALKEAEKLGEELKRMYLSAKPITQTNDSRPVREAVEAIFRAADMFGEATKVLNKQDMQEKSEEEAAKIKTETKGRGKNSSLGGLVFAAAE
jgi:hypothetical protein